MDPLAVPPSFRLRGGTAILVLCVTLAPVSLARGERIEDRWSRLEIPSGFRRAPSRIEHSFEEMVRKAASIMPAQPGEVEKAEARAFVRDAGAGSSDVIVMGYASGRFPLDIAAPGYVASFKGGMERTIGAGNSVDWVQLRSLSNGVEMLEASASGPGMQERMALIPRSEALVFLMVALAESSPRQTGEAWNTLLASFQTSSSPPPILGTGEKPVDWLKLVLALLVLTGAFFVVRAIYRTVVRRVT